MNGSTEIYKTLLANSTVTGYVTKKSTYPCISDSLMEPSTWGVADTTITLYRVSPLSYADEYIQANYTVNCRGAKQSTAEALAGYVATALNRRSSSGGAHFTCSIEPVITPVDSTDNFNVPVTVTVKGIK